MKTLKEMIFKELDLEPKTKFNFIQTSGRHEIVYCCFLDEDLNVFRESGERLNPLIVSLQDIINNPDRIIKRYKLLLTEEEKEFLNYFGFDSLKKVKGRAIMFTIQAHGGMGYALGLNALRLRFDGLQFDKEYSKEELGL